MGFKHLLLFMNSKKLETTKTVGIRMVSSDSWPGIEVMRLLLPKTWPNFFSMPFRHVPLMLTDAQLANLTS